MPKPYREVYTVITAAGVDKKDRWVRIGVAFPNKDGSESVILHALPVNGKLQLRAPKAKDADVQQA